MSTTNSNKQLDTDDPALHFGECGFYKTPELSQRIDLIRHLIDSSDLVPLVTGEAGAGKSMLVNQLQLQTTESWLLCRIDANPMLHPDQLMVRLARFFGVSEAGDNIRDRLLRCFEANHDEGRLAVIIVDDADQLPPASLIALLRLHEQRLGSMPIVALALFALPDIENTIATPQLQVMNLQQFHLMEMPLIAREQAPGYVKYLLDQEDLSDQYAMMEARLESLFRLSEGRPAQLTQLILQSINERVSVYKSKEQLLSKKTVGIGIAVFLVVILLFQDQVNQLFETEVEPKQQALALPDQEMMNANGMTKLVLPPELIPVQPLVGEQPQNTAQRERVQQPIEPVEQSVPLAEKRVEIVVEEELAESENERLPLQEVVAPIVPDNLEKQQSVLEKNTNIITDDSLPKEVLEEPEEKIDIVVKPKPKVVVERPLLNELEGTQWILQQPATNFTLQLIGVSELKSLRQFMDQHELKGRVFYIKSVRKNRPWYTLLTGNYQNLNKAKAAMPRDLPSSLQKRGVWARSFESLQQDLIRDNKNN